MGASRGGGRRFVLDNVLVAVTQVLTKLRGLITLPLLIHAMGPAGYGTWVQVISSASILGTIFGLCLQTALVHFIAAHRERVKEVYSTVLLTTLALGVLGGLTVGLALPGPSATFLTASDDRNVFYAALALTLSNSLRLVQSGVYRSMDRMLSRSLVEFISNAGDLILTVAMLSFGSSLSELFFANAAWGMTVALGATVHLRRAFSPAAFSLPFLREALRYSLPLVPGTLATFVLDRGDRFIIQDVLGGHEAGLYSANYALASMLGYVLLPLQITLFPKVSSLWSANRPSAERYLDASYLLLAGCAGLFLGVTWFAIPSALQLMAPAAYRDDAALNAVCIAGGLAFWGLSVIQMIVLYASKRTRAVGLIGALAAAVNVALNLLLVPKLGILGGALSTLLTYALMAGAVIFASRGEYVVAFRPRLLLSFALSGALAAIPFAAFRPHHVAALLGTSALSVIVYLFGLLVLGALPISSVKAALASARGRAKPAG